MISVTYLLCVLVTVAYLGAGMLLHTLLVLLVACAALQTIQRLCRYHL